MGRNLDPKCKQCRRIGDKLFLKGDKCFSTKCPLVKRGYPPGDHGPKGQRRLSEYGQQLKEKQKAKKTYRLLEKQFNNYYKKAVNIKGDTGENLLFLLEFRLDNVVYRLGLTRSRDEARQLIKHRHITVNKKKIDIPSYQAKLNDIIGIKPKSLGNKSIQESLKSLKTKELPEWLAITNKKEFEAKIINKPDLEMLKKTINASLIVEYYSK